MNYNCSYDELISVDEIKPHEKNPNTHSLEQIKRLSEIIEYQGQRSPLVVSNQTGFLIVGHGRLSAMKMLGWEKIAVNFQDFENEAQEYAHMTADNAIAEWAELDLSMINNDFIEIGPDIDIEMLGIKDFTLEPFEEMKPDSVQPDSIKKYLIEIQFPNDMEMMDIHDDLVSRGYMVKLK